tara:strand:+ start:409 stop:642 length:234 start_codon:yes stop_codon:yes gene_type:complete
MTPLLQTKKILVNGNRLTVVEEFINIHKWTKSGKAGKRIKCPNCGDVQRVYEFSWTSRDCPNCRSHITKYEWLVEQL